MNLSLKSITTLRSALLLEKQCIKAALSPPTGASLCHDFSSFSSLSMPLKTTVSTKSVRTSLPFSSDAAACDLVEFSPASIADGDDKYFKVITEFADPAEERSVLDEVSRAFRRKKYQYDHWDGVGWLSSQTGNSQGVGEARVRGSGR